MKKRNYKRIMIKDLSVQTVLASVKTKRVIVGIDVAKEDMVAAICNEDASVATTVQWRNPGENEGLIAVLGRLRDGGHDVQIALEPTGSYGDVLRAQLRKAGYPVYRVSSKHTYDAAELFDGVMSLHDAKSAAVVAMLHVTGRSALWVEKPDEDRALRALLKTLDVYQRPYQAHLGRLEAMLAVYWPELPKELELTSACILVLLGKVGGPKEVSVNPQKARRLLHGHSHGLLKPEKISAILDSADKSCGVPMMPEEREALSVLANEMHRLLKATKEMKRKIEAAAILVCPQPLYQVVGKVTAAVLYSEAGDPSTYKHARAYQKALGLNLREKSSGKQQGRLRISKRGSSRVRQYLWLVAARMIASDAVCAAWYRKKVLRDGGKKMRAMVGLMRKISRAIYYVARGETFDSTKLFDITRLELPGEQPA